MRYRVDPVELHAAASSVDVVAGLAGQARQRVAACDPDPWCLDRGLAAAMASLFDSLDRAAAAAQEHAGAVTRALQAAAEGYHDTDTPRPR